MADESRSPCAPLPGSAQAPALGADAPRQWREGDAVHIDVRGLPPPQPLVAIMRLVHSLAGSDTPLVVHHDRDPVLLYPELAEIGWSAERIDAPPGEIRLMLRRLA